MLDNSNGRKTRLSLINTGVVMKNTVWIKASLAIATGLVAMSAHAGDFPSGYSKCADQGGTCTVKNAPNMVA